MALVVGHAKMTTSSVEMLSSCIRNAIDRRRDEVQRNFNLLEMKEKEADSLRREIINELARGQLPADERVGLMRLARQVDWIMDWSHEAGRILVLFDLSEMPKKIQEGVVGMCSTLIRCTVKVADCVQKLMDGELENSLKAADEVERLEEDIDILYQNARRDLKDIQVEGTKVGSIILLAQFLEAIENTSDRCEDSCDQARVMAVTLSKKKE
jgi:predicted phosphate transport protein (TIGR00153 family)